MRRLGPALFLTAILCSVFSGTVESKEPLRFFLREITARSLCPPYGSLLADIDGDGRDELFIDRGDALAGLRMHGQEFIPFGECSYQDAGRALGFCDANEEGRREFFVYDSTEAGQSIASYSWPQLNNPSLNYIIGPFLPKRVRPIAKKEGVINFMGCFDADGNGRSELYLGINSYYPKPVPRSLRAYDAATGDTLWHYDIGPQTMMCKPVSSDIGHLVVMSTFACDNGASWNGTSDTLSSICCFRPNGKLVWTRRVTGPGGWSEIDTITCAADAHQKILVGRFFGESDKRKHAWSVAMLDPKDGSFFRTRALETSDSLGTGVSDILAADLDGDSEVEVLAIGTDGRFYILNNDLSVRSAPKDRLHRQPDQPSIVAVTDLNGDKSKEIVLAGANGILVRDASGNLLAEEDLKNPYQLDVAVEGPKKYIVAQSNNMVAFYSLERFGPRLTIGEIAGLVIVCAGVGAGVGISAFGLRRWLRWRRIANAYLEEARYDLLVAMTAFRHGGSSSRVLDRLQFHLINWEQMKPSLVDKSANFAELIDSFRETVVPDLRQLVFLSRKAKVPREHWTKIIRSASNAGELLPGLLDQLSKPVSTNESVKTADALSSVAAISGDVAAIGKDLHGIYRTPILPSLGRVVSCHEEELSAIGCSPKMSIADASQTAVFVSINVFEKVVDGIVANAIRAMEHQARPELEISIRSEGADCIMDFRDNGSGIAQADWERIFERYYTTKEQGGFGLHYSREELAKFGGEIFVLESFPGRGSTIRTVLKHAQ